MTDKKLEAKFALLAEKYAKPVGYWCVVCGKLLPHIDGVVVVHDNIPHPPVMTFDEEGRPQ